MLNSIFSFIFGWALIFGKPWDILLISGALTFLITLSYKYLTDQEKMSHLKSEQKRFQEEMKLHREDKEKMMEIQKESLKVSMDYFKHSMKPMLYTFLPLILIFGWVRNLYPAVEGAKVVLIPLPFWGGLGWLGTYILSSIVFSTIFRKVLKVH